MKQTFTPRVKSASAGFIAEIIEMPEITATGSTPEEARKNLMKALTKFQKDQREQAEAKPAKKPASKRKNG